MRTTVFYSVSRGRSSTTTPESGVYSFTNPDTADLSNQDEDSVAMEVTPGSHGDLDWNQVKLQNIRSLRTPEENVEGMEDQVEEDGNAGG